MDNYTAELDAITIQEDVFSDREVAEIELELLQGTALTKEAAVSDLKAKREKELQYLHEFRKNPSQKTFEPLYNSFEPMILKATQRNMFGSPIPKAAHRALAAQSFLDATKNWKPSAGSFSTYAFSTIANKGKRLNLKYQNFGYIPEGRATKYQSFQTALHLLREELGRDPSTHELADEMALPVVEVERLQKEVKKSYLEDSSIQMKGPAFAQSDNVVKAAHDFMHQLIPAHQVVLEYALGMNGKPSLTKATGGPDIKAIMKTSGQSEAQVRSALKTISRKIKSAQGLSNRMDIEDIFGGEISGG